MSKIDQRFYEDRALRDAARNVFKADIAHSRATFSGKALAERMVGRIGDGAVDVFETAKDRADDNRGIIAALIGAILLWFARGPVLEMLGLTAQDDADLDDAMSEAPDAEETLPAEPDIPDDSPSLHTPSGEDHD